MIIINDEKKFLNLNYMAIYLMLTHTEILKYGRKLKSLNKDTTLTRDMFHFDIVEKGNNPYDELPEEMTRATSQCNLMVRLVNSIHGIFCYGFDIVDLNAEMPDLVRELNRIVDTICRENIKQLEILHFRTTSTSQQAKSNYYQRNIVIRRFEDALQGKDGNTVHAMIALTRFGENSRCPDMSTSHDFVKGAINEIFSVKLEKERNEREKPSVEPRISIKVTPVKTGRVRKDGSEQKKLGVEFTIDGDVVPVSFGLTDQTFLYLATLFAMKEKRRFGRAVFCPLDFHESTWELQCRKKNTEWLKERYCALDFSRKFEDWYAGVKEDPHPLDVAKSQIKKKLWDAFYPRYKDAYYYTVLRIERGSYIVHLNDIDITFDKKIMERLESRL